MFKAKYEKHNIILSSDVIVGRKSKNNVIDTKNFRPDIFIGIEKENDIYPIAFFQIKSSIVKAEVLKHDVFTIFKQVEQDFKELAPYSNPLTYSCEERSILEAVCRIKHNFKFSLHKIQYHSMG